MIERVAIVGGGFMGSGIAETVAVAGLSAVVIEVDPAAAQRTHERIRTSLDHAHRRGKLSAEQAAQATDLIDVATSVSDVAGADLVVEAVPESLDVKVEVMRAVGNYVDEEVIIGSNTSSIPIAHLAAAVANPQRVIGLHFFSPVPVMKLVELVRGLDTSDETLTTAREFAERIGKHPIQTKDRSGFIVNMLLIPYLVAGVRMYEEGFASREDIDAGMRLGCGHPMGPLELCDFIGLDVVYAVCDSLYEEFKRTEYAPPPLLKRMLASGRLGRKSNLGFYEYTAAPVAA